MRDQVLEYKNRQIPCLLLLSRKEPDSVAKSIHPARNARSLKQSTHISALANKTSSSMLFRER